MKKLLVVVTVVLSLSKLASAAEEVKEVSFKPGGAINLAVGTDGVFLNFAGPQVRLDYGQFGAAMAFFPSLRLSNTYVTPILGVGPMLNYEKIYLSLPFYFIANSWTCAVGLGWKF